MTMLNLISLLGLFAMMAIAWCLSSHRDKINWRLVIFGLVLQLVFAAVFFNSQSWTFSRSFDGFGEVYSACESEQIAVANVPLESKIDSKTVKFGNDFGKLTESEMRARYWSDGGPENKEILVPRFNNGILFYVIESFFKAIKRSVDEGAKFVFNVNAFPEDGGGPTKNALLSTFAFGILPTVIFFASLMSILYYLGVMQKLVRLMAWVMRVTLGTSAAESLAAAANVLVGHTEAPLVVKPYIATMTRSELNALMVGGFATISGSLMAAFAGMGVSAGHLLTASIISAPAALILAKILLPETEPVVSLDDAEAQMDKTATNVIEAAANGASEGMKLAINIAAMLLAFLALIMLADIILQTVGGWFGMKLSVALIFGYLFYPLAWLLGIASDDLMVAGKLLGEKMVLNEFVAYLSLLDLPTQGEGAISDRTRVILTYALCGFSNFGAIGIQIGGIGPLAPERKSDLAQLGLRAMFGGMLAACMTACIAGIFYGLLG